MLFKFMFPIGFLIVIISLLVISYLAGDSTITSYLTNSDAIFLPDFYSDIFGGSGHIHDWHRPPPGFIFPDYIFFLAAYVFGKNIFIQIAIFIAIQAMAAFVAVYLLMKQVLEKDVLLLSILAISVFAWCALNAGEPFVFMLVSVHHYGIFISGVLFLAILLKYLKCASDQRQKFLLLLSIFSVVCVLSDLLFLIQVLIPLVFWGTLANYWGFEKGRYSNYITSIAPWVLGVLCLASCIVFYLTYPYPLYDFYGKMKLLATKAPFVFYYLISFFLFSLFLFSRIIRQKSCLQIPKQIVHLVMFSLFSSAITSFAILFKNHNEFVLRYAISTFSWAIITGIVLVSHFLKNKFYYPSRAFAVILMSSIGIHGI